MQKAVALKQGSRVRIVAPASAFDVERFERGCKVLRDLGLELDFGKNLYSHHLYLAGDDQQRGDDLVDALQDPAVTCIWCARGGYGCTRLLPRLQSIRPAGAKLLIGFSDVSALLVLWTDVYDMACIHGPVLTSLGDEPANSLAHLWKLLSGGICASSLDLTTPHTGPDLEGRLCASNLTLLNSLVGTPFFPRLRGRILCVEEVGERPYRLDRQWTQLRQAGVLDDLTALVLGRFDSCDERDGSIRAEQALTMGLDGFDVPVLYGLDIGHTSPNLALPVGARVRISGSRLQFLEDVVDVDAALV